MFQEEGTYMEDYTSSSFAVVGHRSLKVFCDVYAFFLYSSDNVVEFLGSFKVCLFATSVPGFYKSAYIVESVT